MTVNVHRALLPLLSVAVTVTDVDPSGKADPDGLLYDNLGVWLLLSVAEAGGYDTGTLVCPGETDIRWSCGQITLGGVVSIPVPTIARWEFKYYRMSISTQWMMHFILLIVVQIIFDIFLAIASYC